MEHTLNIEGKNTLRIVETSTGAILILKESERLKPKKNTPYYYVAFHVLRGFFSFSVLWTDSEMDKSLFEAGNCFLTEIEAIEFAESFNKQLKR